MTRLYITTQQLDIALEAIGEMLATGEGLPLPVARKDRLFLPSEKEPLDAFLYQIGTALPEKVAADPTITERKRWGKILACRNLAERVREWRALAGEGTAIPADALPVRFGNILKKAGIRTLEELETWTEDDLRMMRGMGEHGVAAVYRLLARYGKTLRATPAPRAAGVGCSTARSATGAAGLGASPRASSRPS